MHLGSLLESNIVRTRIQKPFKHEVGYVVVSGTIFGRSCGTLGRSGYTQNDVLGGMMEPKEGLSMSLACQAPFPGLGRYGLHGTERIACKLIIYHIKITYVDFLLYIGRFFSNALDSIQSIQSMPMGCIDSSALLHIDECITLTFKSDTCIEVICFNPTMHTN